MRASRASRSRYSARIGSSSPNSSIVPAFLGLRPRKYSSMAPGLATGSNVGFGMKRLILPPTSGRVLPSIWAHCMVRFANSGARWRVNASVARIRFRFVQGALVEAIAGEQLLELESNNT